MSTPSCELCEDPGTVDVAGYALCPTHAESIKAFVKALNDRHVTATEVAEIERLAREQRGEQ